jgi:hypothetical protein
MSRKSAVAPVRRWLQRIGSCAKCMRESFVAMTLAWGAGVPLAAIGAALNVDWLTLGSGMIALATTALWLLHLAAFSLRAVRFSESRLPADAHAQLDRRRAASIFAGAFLVGIGLTARTNASAQTCPPGWLCENFYCDDRNNPQLLCNYLRCETGCIPARANGCISRYETWWCDEGCNCLGDGSAQYPARCSC